ncbi:MAG: beta-ketoacyl-ACP synthase III [Acidobacteriota bacterium]
MTHDAYIRGLGFYVPETVVTNADLEKIVETTDEWITTRTGIRERRVAAPGEASSDLALGAAKAALADAGMDADELTHILVYTLTPDFYCPPTACLLEEKLGIRGKFAQDLNAACSGFVYGLETARAIVALHPEAKVLLCAAEVLTSRTNWADRRTCVLFGDGASAAVIAATPGEGSAHILDARLYSDGSLGHLLTVKGGGSAAPLKLGDTVGEDFFVEMAGQEVFKHAVRNMVSVCEEVLAAAGAATDEVAFLIPHQANMRIIDAVAKKLSIPAERCVITIDRYGNSSASSVGIALAEARAAGRIKPGALVLLAVFGGGFTWGASLLRF